MRPFVVSLLLACNAEDPKDAVAPDSDADTDADTDSDTDTDTDTDTDADTDSDTDTDTGSEGPTVRVHPEIATVLVASWDQREASDEVWLSWSVEGTTHESPRRAVAAGPADELVLGIPAETLVTEITIHSMHDGVEETIDLGAQQTASLPAELFEATPIRVGGGPDVRPEPYLLASVDVGSYPFGGPCYTVILDLQGRIVWYRATRESRLTWQPRVSLDGGSLLVDESTNYTFDGSLVPTVTRVTLGLGQSETYALPDMLISYGELDDGSLVYDEQESLYAFHLTRRHTDGSYERLWSCEPWLSEYVTEYWGCATNTTLWEPARGTVTWSTFETDIVIEIDIDSGEVVREYGPYPGGFDVVPAGSVFVKQHFPNWTPQGTLILSAHDETETLQVGREFEVDEATGSLREIWSVVSDDYAEYGGQIQALPSGNRLWQLGTAGIIEEIRPSGEIVWRVEWPGHLVGNVTPLPDLYALDRGW